MKKSPDNEPHVVQRKNKVVSASEAVSVIQSGDTVATGGFVGIGFAEQLTIDLQEGSWQQLSPVT